MEKPSRLPRSVILYPVFIPAVLAIFLMVIGTISQPDLAAQFFTDLLSFVTRTFGWFYMLAVAFFLLFIVAIAFSRWGDIKLGPDHAEPQYSFLSWFAMLFAAGYGVALLFFGVAEPVLHYASPPAGAAETVDSAKQAMQIAFFHWGFHIWAIYGLVGLILAYFAYRHGLPLTMRSALYPLIGDRIYGPIGHTVDVLAIFGTLFGIGTTLGLSVTQINAGMNYLWPSIPVSHTVQVISIAVITAMATISVVAGLDKGIRNLSLFNIFMACALLMFVFVMGPTLFILEAFLQNTGSYLNNIVERTFNLQAYTRTDWIGNWTLFIFGWTIAWSPFVGLFIAKISRGRTIRQFVIGVMLVPTFFTFFWFSVFGDTALHMIMNEGYTQLIDQVQDDHAIALFKMLEHLPLTAITSFIAVTLIVVFFITSADSGSLVIDSLAAGGAEDTPVWQRIFWAGSQGTVAAVLLLAGGLQALQSMTVASALPFTVIIIIAAIGMWRALTIEGHHETASKQQAHAHTLSTSPANLWQQRLHKLVKFPSVERVTEFMSTNVINAMQQVAKALAEEGWQSLVEDDPSNNRVYLKVIRDDAIIFLYEIRLIIYDTPDYGLAKGAKATQYGRAEVFLRRGGQSYDIFGYNQQTIIGDILDQFEKYLNFLHISPGNLPWNMTKHDELLNDGTPGDTDDTEQP